MKTFFDMVLALLVFPVMPLAACYAAEFLAERLENSLPPCGE